MTTFTDLIESKYNETYTDVVTYPVIELMESLERDICERIFDNLGVGPVLRKRINLKSALIARAIEETRSWQRYSDRGEDFSGLARKVWDHIQVGYEAVYPLLLECKRDEFEERYRQDLEEGLVLGTETLEDYFYDLDLQSEDITKSIVEHVEASDFFWEHLLNKSHNAIDALYEEVQDYTSSDYYSRDYLLNQVCEILGIEPDGHHDNQISEAFIEKYDLAGGDKGLELYVDSVLYVFSAAVYSPETAQLKSEEVLQTLDALSARFPNIKIEDKWTTNPTLYYMLPKNDLSDVLPHVKDAKSRGMQVPIVVEDHESFEVPAGIGTYIDTVYICRRSGAPPSSITSPDFQGDLVLVNNIQTIEWLSAMYLESTGHLAYFVNRAAPYLWSVEEFISCSLGRQSRIIVELSNLRRYFDLRIESMSPTSLTFSADTSDKCSTNFYIDVSENVDIDLQSYFDNSARVADLFLGVYLRDMQAMLAKGKPEYLKKISGLYLSQFDTVNRSVLAYNRSFDSKIYTSSRSTATFKVVYEENRNRADTPLLLGKEGYTMPNLSKYPKDQRGGYVANAIVAQDDVTREGTVFYKCFFTDENYMRTSIAVSPINLEFDLVLV